MKQLGSASLVLIAFLMGFVVLLSCGGGGGASSSVISDAAVCTASGNQYRPDIATDGTGGAIVAWIDERELLGSGDELWCA